MVGSLFNNLSSTESSDAFQSKPASSFVRQLFSKFHRDTSEAVRVRTERVVHEQLVSRGKQARYN